MAAKFSIRRNVWGNLGGFIGPRRVWHGANESDAKAWGVDQLKAGHMLSDRSDVTMYALEEYADRTGDTIPRDPIAEAAKLADMVLALNPTAGTLGEGMARQLHAQARRVLEASK